MSLDIIKKNSNSPFQLQRSIVSQSGEGGAYEEGGYTGQADYSDGGISSGITGFGKIVGAGLSSVTAGDVNESNVKKSKRLTERSKKLTTKASESEGNKSTRLTNRSARIDKKVKGIDAEIKAYDEFVKPTLKSTINKKKEVKDGD